MFRLFAALPLVLVSSCSTTPPDEPAGRGAPPVAEFSPAAVTEPVAHGSVVNAAFFRDPATGELYVLGAAGIAGLDVYRPDGTRVARLDSVEAGLVATVPGAPVGTNGTGTLNGTNGTGTNTNGTGTLAIVYDASAAALTAYTLDLAAASTGGAVFRAVMSEPIAVADELTGLCHYRSRLSSADYLYGVTDAGLIRHYELYATADGVGGRLLRTIPSAKGSGFCAVDPRDGALYVAEETTGVWRIGAEPEADTTREPVDLSAPFGSLSDDVKGVAVLPVSDELAYLLVADLGNGRIAVYDLADGKPAASFTVAGLAEPEGLAVSGDGAWFAAADEDPADGGTDVKIVDFAAALAQLGLAKADSASDGVASAENAALPVVRPVAETDVIPTWGDSADDPAIWVHPDDPARSLVIGTGKKSGLYVFDLDGTTLQVLDDGRMNNVDVRDGFSLGGRTVPIVAASNRSNDGIALYAIDPYTRRLTDVTDGVLDTGFADPYGLCLYRSAGGEFFVFVNDGGTGEVRQWRLAARDGGRVGAELVREFAVGSQAEGCVADDLTGALYVAEEDVGLWKYSAGPDGGDARTAIDATGDHGRLTDDVEGVAIYDGGDGRGFLVVSNQGANNYAVYRREGDNQFVGFFHVVANAAAGIDGASETDGLDVTSAALGDDFAGGLLVVQDGRNIAPEERQNFKYVAWRDVAAALGIDMGGP